MATVVIDNTNQADVLADARGEKIPVKEPEKVPDDKATNGAEPAKESEKIEADDIEGEDGLTPRQKREFSAAMLKSLGKKHAKQRQAEALAVSAEEFATDQYNTRRLAEQRAENLERELDNLKKAQIVVKPAVEAVEPKRADFETDEKYRDALIDWRVDQRLQAKQREDQQKADQAHQRQVIEQANTRIAKSIELIPDFKAVTEACDWETPPYIASYMQESEMFGELGYFLAKPEQSELRSKLTKMRPEAALVEIGKIESKLSPFAVKTDAKNGNGADKPSTDASQASSNTDASQNRSRAAVIKPLSAGSAIQVDKDEAEMTPQEALAAWQKKHGVNLSARKRH